MADRVGTNALMNMLGDWSLARGIPLHRRLAEAMVDAIDTGVLPAGSVLPAERALARSLAISRSTVTAAMNELKAGGILESRQGSGTRVVGTSPGGPPGATVLPGIINSNGVPAYGVIDLAASTPNDALALPQVEVDLAALMRSGPRHGYTPAGLPALRLAVAERLSLGGLATEIDNVLITNGAQHGLALALNMLTNKGDGVLVDEPTYPGIFDLLSARGLRAVPLPRTGGGIDVAGLRRLVGEQRLSLAYLQTSVHNPTGFTADEWQFRSLAQVCDDLNLTVLEDLVLADLRYDGSRPTPLAGRVETATVLAIGSLSKLGWGGLRIGWLQAPHTILDRLIRARLSDDLGSSIPSQVIAAGVLANFDQVADVRQRTLRSRSEAAGNFLAELVPEWKIVAPEGGLSMWIELPGPYAEPLAQTAARHGVAVATGSSASVGRAAVRHIRLCFDRPEAQLLEGLRRLVRAWRVIQVESVPESALLPGQQLT